MTSRRYPTYGWSTDDLDALAEMAVLDGGRRPAWWDDRDIRRFLTASHRQKAVRIVIQEGAAIFGPGFASQSSVARYWQRVDEAKRRRARTLLGSSGSKQEGAAC